MTIKLTLNWIESRVLAIKHQLKYEYSFRRCCRFVVYRFADVSINDKFEPIESIVPNVFSARSHWWRKDDSKCHTKKKLYKILIVTSVRLWMCGGCAQKVSRCLNRNRYSWGSLICHGSISYNMRSKPVIHFERNTTCEMDAGHIPVPSKKIARNSDVR